jgi:hypothetical protein
MPDIAFPSVGPLGLGSPPSRLEVIPPPIGTILRYDLRLPFSAASLVARPTDTRGVPLFSCLPFRGSLTHRNGLPAPGLLVYRQPFSPGLLCHVWRQPALASSRVTLWNACPVPVDHGGVLKARPTVGSGGSSNPFELGLSPAPLMIDALPALLPSASGTASAFLPGFVGKLSH